MAAPNHIAPFATCLRETADLENLSVVVMQQARTIAALETALATTARLELEMRLRERAEAQVRRVKEEKGPCPPC